MRKALRGWARRLLASARAQPTTRDTLMCRFRPFADGATAASRALAAAFLAAATASAPLCAAPLEPGDPRAPDPSFGAGSANGITAPTSSSVPGAGSTSDTVEMLLRLHQASGAGGDAVPGTRAAPPIVAGEAKDAQASPGKSLKALKDSLFGTTEDAVGALGTGGAALSGSERDALRVGPGDVPTSATARGVDQPTSTSVRSSGSGAAGSGLLANPVVRFIRENRMLSIGASLGLLAAVWFTATYRGRDRRHRSR